MKPLRELFPIIDECESWLSQGRTGNDWGRRMRFASFIDEVKDYRIEATKYDEVVELWRKWEEDEIMFHGLLIQELGKIVRGSTPTMIKEEK